MTNVVVVVHAEPRIHVGDVSGDDQTSWEERRGTTKENHGGQSMGTEENLRQRRREKFAEFPLVFKLFGDGKLDEGLFRVRMEILITTAPLLQRPCGAIDAPTDARNREFV